MRDNLKGWWLYICILIFWLLGVIAFPYILINLIMLLIATIYVVLLAWSYGWWLLLFNFIGYVGDFIYVPLCGGLGLVMVLVIWCVDNIIFLLHFIWLGYDCVGLGGVINVVINMLRLLRYYLCMCCCWLFC